MATYTMQGGYIGLSTDSKPTDDSVRPGSVFVKSNTGAQWIYTGSEWVEDLRTIYALERVING